MLRRDLDGTGIKWKYETGEIVDFHTLRSTGITLMVEHPKLTPRRVQKLARLSTLALVYRYSRKMRMDDYGWLDQPIINVSGHKQKMAS